MTPEQWIFLVGGLGVAWWLARTFVARPSPAPVAQPPPRVLARVVEDHPGGPPDLGQIMAQFNQAIEAQGTALAYSRKANEMIEAKAASVNIAWAASAPPKSEPPKA